jgi:hypothetical protein
MKKLEDFCNCFEKSKDSGEWHTKDLRWFSESDFVKGYTLQVGSVSDYLGCDSEAAGAALTAYTVTGRYSSSFTENVKFIKAFNKGVDVLIDFNEINHIADLKPFPFGEDIINILMAFMYSDKYIVNCFNDSRILHKDLGKEFLKGRNKLALESACKHISMGEWTSFEEFIGDCVATTFRKEVSAIFV